MSFLPASYLSRSKHLRQTFITMKPRIFYLSTCDTCRKILKEINADAAGFILQDIKTEMITPQQLDHLKDKAGSYEALFNKKARLYKESGLANQDLTESEYRHHLLSHYTFLKRPVVEYGDQLFIGNARATIDSLKTALGRQR